MERPRVPCRRSTWSARRGDNPLDGGAPWYSTYETADGKYVAVGAIEEKFWLELLVRLGIEPGALPDRETREHWGAIREVLSRAFRQRSREEWTQVFRGSDACVTPVLELSESSSHEHMSARGNFAEIQGATQPAPAPRLSRTPGRIRATPVEPRTAAEVLRDWGVESSV